MLFAPQVQPFLIAQGGRDVQVAQGEAELLSKAQPKARLLIIPSMNHVLKDVASDGREANLATYADPTLPVSAQLPDPIADFVKR